MSETEILNLVKALKTSVTALKEKNNDLKTHYKELKEYCDGIQAKLDAALQEKATLEATVKDLGDQISTNEATIAELNTKIESIQKQGQQSLEDEKTARENFMQELTKAVEEANEALKD